MTESPWEDGRMRAIRVNSAIDSGGGGLSVPDTPASLTAMPGAGEAELEWTAAPDDGGSPETGSSFASVNSVRRQQRMVREDMIRRNASRQAVVVALLAFLPNPLVGQRATTVSPTLPTSPLAVAQFAAAAAAHLAREAPGALAWEAQFAFTREPTGAETRPLSRPFRGDGHANDARAVTPFLYIQTTASSIREGESGTVTAAWSEALADSLTITLTPTSKGNTTTDDHTVTGGLVLVIPPGETTSPDTVTIAVADNHRNEIGYAASRGKPVRYVTDDPDLLARIAPLNQGAVA